LIDQRTPKGLEVFC